MLGIGGGNPSEDQNIREFSGIWKVYGLLLSV